MRRQVLFATFCLLLIVGSISDARRKISVGPLLTERLESILDTSQELHEGLVNNEPDQVEVQMKLIGKAIDGAIATSGEAGSNKPHLMRILERTRRSIEQARAYDSDGQRREVFKDAFSQIVLLAQAYKLNKRYRIYFCSKDKAVWLQKNGRAKNPVHPDKYPKCGTIVRY